MLMNKGKRRGGYLATAEGVKKLKEAKRIKKYTYEKIAQEAKETLDKVKRLFNPQWGNGKYKIGEEAVEAICTVLDLQPEDIVADWYAVEISTSDSGIQEVTEKEESNIDSPYNKALRKIEQAARDGLEELDLSGMELTELPPEIGKLSRLKKLILGKYDKRKFEWIGNSLSNLPPEIGQLTNLSSLSLSSNSLSNLPPEIGQLTNLSSLNLRLNSLSNLPPEIGQLTNLEYLDLSSNSLDIPPEILRRRFEAAKIINYYLSLQVNQKKPLHEAKMLLVGQGSVGKTSLVNRLIRNHFNPKENKTDGINIQPWQIEVDNRQIQLNVWDFGGQEIMHATHQFFLTKRSLYLLVLDARLGEEDNRIEYWLKIIKSFGQDSPIIVVGNKIDQHPLDIDKTGLQRKYPNIKAFVETSCDNGQGIEKLTATITQEINQLEHIDDQLPLTWFNIKKELETIDLDFIPYSKYETLCKKEGVTEEDNQKTLVKFLHDLGIVLNFCDDPRLEGTHVLNPEWVTNGVYKILNDRQLILDHKGILAISMLNRILEKARYPTSKHLFIIDMMRKFELCFDVEPDKKFLIPDIVPKKEPETGEWDKTLAFEYHYPVLPSSIISRFIVRMNHWISQETYWRSGVVLAKEGNKALVKADREDKKIIIRVKGTANTRRNLLTAIRSQFDYIHKTIPGIVPEEKVPLIDHPEIILDYQELLGLEEMGETSVVIGKLKQRIPLKQLLDGIESQQNRRQKDESITSELYPDRVEILTTKEVNKEIFISYSWREESKKIADELDAAFQAKGITITRDLRDVKYKDRIQAFMENIGRGKCVIVIISKAYLESENCMFELLQIAKHGKFYDRIFPIVLPDAKIYKPKDRIKYVKYWEQETNELDEAMKTVSSANLQGFREDIDLYTEIRNNLPQLTNILKDINSLTAKIHSESGFTELIEAVELRLME